MNRELGLRRTDRGQLFDLSVSFEQDDHDLRYAEAQGRAVKVSNHHEPLPIAFHLRSNCQQGSALWHCVYNEAYFLHDDVQALTQRFTWLLEQGRHRAWMRGACSASRRWRCWRHGPLPRYNASKSRKPPSPNSTDGAEFDCSERACPALGGEAAPNGPPRCFRGECIWVEIMTPLVGCFSES